MLPVSTTRIIPGRAVPSFLSGRYSAVKVRKKLYVTGGLPRGPLRPEAGRHLGKGDYPHAQAEGLGFTTAIIERCCGREASVEEAPIERCLAEVSTRWIEDVSEILWGSGVSAATVSNLNQRAFDAVEEWRNRRSRGLPLRLLRRHLPQARLGRELQERDGDGRHRGERRRLPQVTGVAEGLAGPNERWRAPLVAEGVCVNDSLP